MSRIFELPPLSQHSQIVTTARELNITGHHITGVLLACREDANIRMPARLHFTAERH